ncbi:MAG: alpha/beta fold hydrolase [Stackebrandtia sp.]
MVTTLVRGAGEPATVFAHGLGADIADTRPLGSGVDGTKVFYTARAHDGVETARFDYEALAADLRAVADEHGAGRALGVSMGAGALCRLVCDTPDRFERFVLFLPAVIDEPRGTGARDRLSALGQAIARGDTAAVHELIAAELPEAVRDTPAGRAYAAARVKILCRPSMRGIPARLAELVAVPDARLLSKVDSPVLVLGCRGDVAHPAAVAERLAALLPKSQLHIFDKPDVMWTHRSELRERIGHFLNSPRP